MPYFQIVDLEGGVQTPLARADTLPEYMHWLFSGELQSLWRKLFDDGAVPVSYDAAAKSMDFTHAAGNYTLTTAECATELGASCTVVVSQGAYDVAVDPPPTLGVCPGREAFFAAHYERELGREFPDDITYATPLDALFRLDVRQEGPPRLYAGRMYGSAVGVNGRETGSGRDHPHDRSLLADLVVYNREITGEERDRLLTGTGFHEYSSTPVTFTNGRVSLNRPAPDSLNI